MGCNSIRIYGDNPDNLLLAAKTALEKGLKVWLSPRLINGQEQETLGLKALATIFRHFGALKIYMLGLKSGTVKLTSHHKQWAELFKKEKKRLLSVLNKININIEHVGSTAIPGLKAKPILDTILSVPTKKLTKTVYKILEKNGYTDHGEVGIVERHLFVRGTEEKRTHHLHVTLKDSNFWKEHIQFRDYLLLHKSALKKYDALKRKLAKQYANDRKSYTKAKNAFIQNILAKTKNHPLG